MESSKTPPSVELWCRFDVPPVVQRTRSTVCDRLRTLQSEGMIDEVSVNRWGSFLYLREGPVLSGSDPARDAFRAFERWASEYGFELEPAFERYDDTRLARNDHERLCDGTYSPTSTQVIRLPIMSLAIYEGERLVGVAPSSDGSQTYTVTEGLEVLEGKQQFI